MKTFALLMGLATLLSPVYGQNYRRTVKLSMPYLESFQTTEAGEDEVYLVVSGRWSSGQTFSYRFPNESGHWDLNDGEGDPPVLNQNLMNFTIDDGQSVELVILVMEEDGGSSGGWVQLAGSAAGVINEAAGAVITAIGSLINIEDSDDFIGAATIRITNEHGYITTRMLARDRASTACSADGNWQMCEFEMTGDGSNYVVRFSADVQ
jgi:hypothetical protein